jgi:hypothetical protein
VSTLWILGATPETAFLAMSAISAAAPIAFWYLICVVLAGTKTNTGQLQLERVQTPLPQAVFRVVAAAPGE